jgi:hypothetical protein
MKIAKKNAVIFAAIALVVLAGAVYLREPAKVPAGQPPLLTLSPANLKQFASAFDADTDAPRLVLLFSPT